MTNPRGEGIQSGSDFGALPPTLAPTYELIHPQTAPAGLLDRVQVDTPNRCLQADTLVGNVAVEVYWQNDADAEPGPHRADFFSPLGPALDPSAAANPQTTQRYPYTILPDGALYTVAVRAPRDAADHTWSEPTQTAIRPANIYSLLKGVNLSEFRQRFPHIPVPEGLRDGLYDISATEQTRPTLVVAARVEQGEPLTRTQTTSGIAVHYQEMPMAGFMPSEMRPDTVINPINSRVTIRENSTADSQRLEFRTNDGFQRTGPEAEAYSGLVELIVLQGTEVRYSDFTFAEHELPNFSRLLDNRYGSNMRFDVRDSFGSSGGLVGGETRYRKPEVVQVTSTGLRDVRAIAAFRFALTAAPALAEL